MSPAPKRSINLKEILHDIRSKMAEMDLMEKYELTPRQLEAVYKKLESVGFPVSDHRSAGAPPAPRPAGPAQGSQGRPSPAPSGQPPYPGSNGREPAPSREPALRHDAAPPPGREAGALFQCSQCFARMQQRWDPCPRCAGRDTVVEARTLESPQYDQFPPPRSTPRPRVQTASQSNPWLTIGLSVVICTVLAFGLIFIAAKRSSESRASPTPGSTPSVGGSAGIKAFTVDNFAQDVVETSRSVPVLVEFYADW